MDGIKEEDSLVVWINQLNKLVFFWNKLKHCIVIDLLYDKLERYARFKRRANYWESFRR